MTLPPEHRPFKPASITFIVIKSVLIAIALVVIVSFAVRMLFPLFDRL